MDSKCFPNPWMELCLGGVGPTPPPPAWPNEKKGNI